MKLITLNTWGGKLLDSLAEYIKNNQDVDIFCLQEMYYSFLNNKVISRGMRGDLFNVISKILKNHRGYFAPHLKQYDLEGKVDFELDSGLAIFVKNTLIVKECGDLFIYREGYDLLDEKIETIPRNLQYLSFSKNNKQYLISHFHGIWYPKAKLDTQDRIQQSKKIKEFLSGRREAKILCGDFNLLPQSESMQLLELGMKNLIIEFKVKTTRNDLYKREKKYSDYILTSPGINIQKFEVDNVTVSDHLPLLLEFT